MRLPGLGGDDAAIANRLIGVPCGSRELHFEADVFVAGDALAFGEAGGGEDLDAVADGEDPLALAVEGAGEFEKLRVVAKVLGRAAAEEKDGGVVIDHDLIEGEVGFDAVAGRSM